MDQDRTFFCHEVERHNYSARRNIHSFISFLITVLSLSQMSRENDEKSFHWNENQHMEEKFIEGATVNPYINRKAVSIFSSIIQAAIAFIAILPYFADDGWRESDSVLSEELPKVAGQ